MLRSRPDALLQLAWSRAARAFFGVILAAEDGFKVVKVREDIKTDKSYVHVDFTRSKALKKQKFIYFLIFAVCVFYSSMPAIVFGQTVTIEMPDTVLASAVRDALGLASNRPNYKRSDARFKTG